MQDRNAIDVKHSGRGPQIGNITKTLASRLAGLMDSKLITLEGVADQGEFSLLGPYIHFYWFNY